MMTDDAGTSGTQADPPAPATSATQADAAGDDQQQQADPADAPLTRDAARALRSEARTLRERLRVAEADANSLPTVRQRVTDLESTLAQRDRELADTRLELHVTEAARRIGFNDPAVALRLMDRQRVEYQDGAPTNTDALLGELAEQYPYLVTPPRSDVGSWGGGATGQPSRGSTFDDAIREAAGYGRRRT